MNPSSHGPWRIEDRFFVFVIVAMSVVIATLGARLWEVGHPRPHTLLKALAVGAAVPQLRGTDAAGTEVTLDFGSVAKPTVLYAFTPQCGWCLQNMANMKALMAADSGRFRFVGVALNSQGLAAYLATHNLRFDLVLQDLPPGTATGLHFVATPDMLVVSQTGRVMADWRGAIARNNGQDVAERFFGVHLPGLPTGIAGGTTSVPARQ